MRTAVDKATQWHLPPGVYGQRFDDETLVYEPAATRRLSGALAEAWIHAANGDRPSPEHAEALAAMGLLRRREPEGAAGAVPQEGRPAAGLRWRREMAGAIYLVKTSGRFRAYWLVDPLATFWEAFVAGGAPGAHAATVQRFGAAWTAEDTEAFLGELAAEGLAEQVAPAPPPQRRWLAAAPDIEEVSRRIRFAPTPWYLLWEITYACNLRCQTCYAAELHQGTAHGLDRHEAARWTDEIRAASLFHVTLIGGEPFASPHLDDLCARLKEAGTYVKLVSNGTLVTPEHARRLAAMGVNQVDVSADGFTPETNDPIRGAGSFERIRRGVAALLDAGIPHVTVTLTIGAHNLASLTELPSLAADTMGVRDVFLTRMICSGYGREQSRWKLAPQESERLKYLLDEGWPRARPDVRVSTQRWHCDCGRTRCVLSVDLSLRTCTFHSARLGDARDGLLRTWRESRDFDMIRRPYRYNERCRDCSLDTTCKATACSARVFARDQRLISNGCIKEPDVLERYGE